MKLWKTFFTNFKEILRLMRRLPLAVIVKKNLDKTTKLEKWKGYLIHTNQKDFTL